jgi:prepilin-type N-terminal cleavage/methylation domain-containing protein
MNQKSRGFSLIELMIVLLIVMLIAGMAIPSVTQGVQMIRLRESVLSIAGLLQKTRLEAVRTNKFGVARRAEVDGVEYYFVDGVSGGTYDRQMTPREPRVQAMGGVKMIPASEAPTFNGQNLLGFATPSPQTTFNVIFNPRGLPCYSPANRDYPSDCTLSGMSTSQTSQAYYLYFFKLNSRFGDRYAALSITPAGRIRVWTWNGNQWS